MATRASILVTPLLPGFSRVFSRLLDYLLIWQMTKHGFPRPATKWMALKLVMVAVQFLRSTNLTLALKSYKMPSYVIPSLFYCCQKNDECHGREEAFPKLRVCEAIQHVNVFWGIQQHANVWEAEFSPKSFRANYVNAICNRKSSSHKKYRKTRRNLEWVHS